MASSKNQQPPQLQLTPEYAGGGKWEACGLWGDGVDRFFCDLGHADEIEIEIETDAALRKRRTTGYDFAWNVN